ncbi:enolase C-terminal domain-like protein, partial [Paraburkholderia caledonica]|uniref:enolase C-terminal domain-like protein n=1 Tax=Paraburkholderia caledonica TaxID=134536 RepID=UPI00277D1600
EYMKRLERYDLFWIEEPFSPDDIDNHVRLAKATRVTVATGEIEAGRWRFKELLERGATSLLQTDATVCGGVTEWRRIAATAASFGVPVAPHAWHDLHVHLVACAPNATYAEFMPDAHIVNFRKLIDTQIVAEKGRCCCRRRPVSVSLSRTTQLLDTVSRRSANRARGRSSRRSPRETGSGRRNEHDDEACSS